MELQQKMFKIVEKWNTSNLSKGEFLFQEKVTYHSLNYWIKKYNKLQNESRVVNNEAALSFFELPATDCSTKKLIKEKTEKVLPKRMEIEFGNGTKVTIYQ